MSLSITTALLEPTEVNAGTRFILRVGIDDTLAGLLLLRDSNAAGLRDKNGKYLLVEG